jgi:hypothetical protein
LRSPLARVCGHHPALRVWISSLVSYTETRFHIRTQRIGIAGTGVKQARHLRMSEVQIDMSSEPVGQSARVHDLHDREDWRK